MWRCCNRNNPGRCLMTEDLLTRNVNYTFTSEENSRAPLAVWNAACCIFTTLKISKLYFWNIPKKRDWDGFICVWGNNKLFSECALANAWDESNKVKRRLATVRRLSPCGYYITGSWSVVTGFRMTYVRLQCRLILWDCFFFLLFFFDYWTAYVLVVGQPMHACVLLNMTLSYIKTFLTVSAAAAGLIIGPGHILKTVLINCEEEQEQACGSSVLLVWRGMLNFEAQSTSDQRSIAEFS